VLENKVMMSETISKL